jgi:hypothetical protein
MTASILESDPPNGFDLSKAEIKL